MIDDMKYSVIIPALNEEYHISKCIRSVKNNFPDTQIIVADGGSVDLTTYIARNENVTVINTQANRGLQLNTASESAEGDLLIFLHSDTTLPDNAYSSIDRLFSDPRVLIATFSMNFDVDFWLLNIYSKFTKFDSLFTRFGDHCIVVKKSFFIKIGKFPQWPLFEDVQFLRNARKVTKIYTLDGSVVTSSRRFLTNGVFRTQIRSAFYILQYLVGVSPYSLYKKYNKMKNLNDNSIIVFSKYPESGKVKTRIAKTMGNGFALNLYKICSEHTFDEVLSVNSNRVVPYLFTSGEASREKIKSWARTEFFLELQQGEDLGERMCNAFRNVFSSGTKRAIIVGTDLPDISAEIIEQGFDALDESDIVIGPSNDGGYYILGMKNLYEDLFKNIEWSTNTVLSKTLEKIYELNLNYKMLPEFMDIDTEEDLKNWLIKESSAKVSPVKSKIESLYVSLNKSHE